MAFPCEGVIKRVTRHNRPTHLPISVWTDRAGHSRCRGHAWTERHVFAFSLHRSAGPPCMTHSAHPDTNRGDPIQQKASIPVIPPRLDKRSRDQCHLEVTLKVLTSIGASRSELMCGSSWKVTRSKKAPPDSVPASTLYFRTDTQIAFGHQTKSLVGRTSSSYSNSWTVSPALTVPSLSTAA